MQMPTFAVMDSEGSFRPVAFVCPVTEDQVVPYSE